MRATFLASVFAVVSYSSSLSSFIPPSTDCRMGDGSYRGAVDVTESGSRCMNWSEVAGFPERHPGSGIGEHNQCRNPDARIRPWCFFRNHRGRVDWGYCDCKQGSVRLQGGRSKLDGMVEVYLGGVWGSVCGNHWTDEDAAVVCRQLGEGCKKGNRHLSAVNNSSGIHSRKCSPFFLNWSLVLLVQFLSFTPKKTSFIGRRSTVREKSQSCSSVPKLPGRGRSVLWRQLLPAPNRGIDINWWKLVKYSTVQYIVGTLPLRLVGGQSESDGRVEVFHAGQWGSICDDQWDDNDAEVVCRQLGLSGVARAWSQAHFGKGTGRVWLDEVRCSGNELTLEQCPKSAWGEHNCLHSEDAGVSCSPLTGLRFPFKDGTTRLVGGAGTHEGRLEIFYRGQWGTVCDDGWKESNTQVVCRQLGYRVGKTLPSEGLYMNPIPRFGVGSGPIILDEVSCTGKEPSLLLCNRREWLHHDCTHHEDVNIACGPERGADSPPASVPVRLVGGECSREGRVELFLSGQWGTVCDDGWTDQDAEVVCRQLGYSGVAKARVMAYFGEGTGPIHVENVKCNGEEHSLVDCIKQKLGTNNCRHSEDAGVICDYGELSSKEVNDPVSPICGLRLIHTRQRRIIGGENSLRGGWPWQAAIRLRGSRGDGRLVCGGTLIDTCWVLTSAHCFKRYGNSTKQYKVRLGDYHSLVPEEYEEEHGVDQIVLHPNYHAHSNDYDLALVRLSRGAVDQAPGECVSFSRHVLPACLPMRKEKVLKEASNCHITGWGDTGRSYSKTLQQAPLSLLPRRHCQQYFHSAFTSRMLCAGSVQSERRVDSCRGDSGGPLMCERPGGGWVVYGVTSWGHACRTQQSPGVYTKVSAFTTWIRKVTGRNEKTR